MMLLGGETLLRVRVQNRVEIKKKVRWKLSFLENTKEIKKTTTSKIKKKKTQIRVYHTCNKMVGNKDGGRFDEEKELKN